MKPKKRKTKNMVTLFSRKHDILEDWGIEQESSSGYGREKYSTRRRCGKEGKYQA